MEPPLRKFFYAYCRLHGGGDAAVGGAVDKARASFDDRAAMQAIDQLKFDEHGLIPAIMQDRGGRVLMVAWMNRESFLKTLETGLTHFYSRSRRKLWLKGESSGHTQKVQSIRTDCDADVLLIEVEQTGVACHEGYRSCFFRQLSGGQWTSVDAREIDPATVYKAS